jgi:hypothetical protein
MSLWNNSDANTSAPIFAPMYVQQAPTQENVDNLYGNTTVDVIVSGKTVGLFGVDTAEDDAAGTSHNSTHAGWVLRTVGSGGRAGRVTEETLIAMGSMTGDASDDTTYPDALLSITTQPGNKSITAGNSATFTVVIDAAPPSAVLSYLWQVNTGASWVPAANGTPANTTYSGNTTTSLVATPTTTEANTALYRVTVSAPGAVSVTTANSVLTVA